MAPAALRLRRCALELAGAEEARHWSVGEPVVLRGRSGPTRLATPVEALPDVRDRAVLMAGPVFEAALDPAIEAAQALRP